MAAEAAEEAKLPACGRDRVRLDPAGSLSVAQFVGLMTEQRFESVDSPGEILAYRPFDYEMLPVDGDWMGVGVLYARGRSGKVVGGILWNLQGGYSQGGGGVFQSVADGIRLTVNTPTDVDQNRKPVCQGHFVMNLSTDGVVVADGQELGSIR